MKEPIPDFNELTPQEQANKDSVLEQVRATL